MSLDITEERLLKRLLIVLGALSTALAAVGLYAVVRWSITERTREIGLRIALGAAPLAVAGFVTRQALGFAFAGLALGFGASIVVARLLRTLLYGVGPFDPTSWTAAAALLLAVALLAAAQPALAAAGLHPHEALRHD
jgi:ABC-type antimicrobial peptide transport system permease subunit